MTVPQPAAQSRRIWLRALVAMLVLAVVAGGAGGAWLLAHNGGSLQCSNRTAIER